MTFALVLFGLVTARADRVPQLLLFNADSERFLLIEASEPTWKTVSLRQDLRQCSEIDARLLRNQMRVYLGPRERLTAREVRESIYGTYGGDGLVLRIRFEAGSELHYNFHYRSGRLHPDHGTRLLQNAHAQPGDHFRKIDFDPATLDHRLNVRRRTLEARTLDELCDHALGPPAQITED